VKWLCNKQTDNFLIDFIILFMWSWEEWVECGKFMWNLDTDFSSRSRDSWYYLIINPID